MVRKQNPGRNKRKIFNSSYLWILWGILFAVLKFAYSFFPLFNLIDVIFFGAIGAIIGRGYKTRRTLRLIFAVSPTLLLIVAMVINIGWDNIIGGIGAGWLLSLILIPLSVFLGNLLQAKFRK